jgi:hypothetical protein
MKIPPLIARVIRLARFSLPALFVLVSTVTVADANATRSRANNVIHVWAIGSPNNGVLPNITVPTGLQRQAENLGYTIEINSFRAAGFAETLGQAVRDHTEPEVLTFDNYGVVWGANPRTGRIEGIGSNFQVMSSLVMVNETLAALQPRGWVMLVSSAANYEAAKSLAMQLPLCAADGGFARRAPTSADLIQAEQTALSAARAYLSCDVASLKSLSDPERLGDKCYLPEAELHLNAVEACAVAGNQKLAFVSLAGMFTAERRPSSPAGRNRGPIPNFTLGRQSVVAILKNRNGAWRLFAISDDPVVTDLATRRKLERLTSLLGGVPLNSLAIQPPRLEIADGARITAPPGQRFGDFLWSADGNSDVVCEVVEFLVREPPDLRERTRLFFLFNHEKSLSAGFLWGIGGLWRVSSIDRQGEIFPSEQRAYYTH